MCVLWQVISFVSWLGYRGRTRVDHQDALSEHIGVTSGCQCGGANNEVELLQTCLTPLSMAMHPTLIWRVLPVANILISYNSNSPLTYLTTQTTFHLTELWRPNEFEIYSQHWTILRHSSSLLAIDVQDRIWLGIGLKSRTESLNPLNCLDL